MPITDYKLKYLIDGDASGLKRELTAVDRQFGSVGTSVSSLGSTVSSVLGPAAMLTGALVGAGAAAIGVGKQLFDLSKQASEYGSAIFDASEKTGLHAETLSAMDFAAKQSGSSLDQVTSSIAKYAKNIGAASDGSKEAVANLSALGEDPVKAANDLDKSLARVFKRIADAKPGYEQITLAQKAFGKSGAELLPFIKSFDGDLAGLIKRAKELGVTIDDDAARAADQFGDQLDTLNDQFDAITRTIGMAFMPTFLDMARQTSDWATRNKDEIKTWAIGFAVALEASKNKITEWLVEARKWRVLSDVMWMASQPGDIIGRTTGIFDEAKRLGEQRRRAEAAAQNYHIDPKTFTLKPGPAPPPGSTDKSFPGMSVTPKGTKSDVQRDSRSDKQVYQDFVKELQKLGITITSGYRTFAEQSALYARLPKGEAAMPGTSDHEFYKAIDLPAGVSREHLEKAARAAGVTLGKGTVHQGTGLHRHQTFSKGRSSGGGEAELERERDEIKRQQEEELRDADAWFQQYLSMEKSAAEERLDIRRAEADMAIEIIGQMVDEGVMTEIEATERLGQLKIDMLQDERSEIESLMPTADNIHRLKLLDLEIDKQRIQNERDIAKAIREQNEEYEKQIRSLQKANQRPGQMKTRQVGPGGINGGLLGSLGIDVNDTRTEAEMIEETMQHLGGMLGDTFANMAQGIGSMVEQWVLYGTAGPDALRKMTAAVLGNLAAQATVEAIMELARGFAALANPWTAWRAPLHFKAAALFGAVAAGSALVGRAVAGDSFTKDSGSRGSSRGSNSGSSSSREQDMRPVSRVSDDAYISGRRPTGNWIADTMAPMIARLADSHEKLANKIDSVKEGVIVAKGISQNPGMIGKAYNRDASRNNGIANKSRRIQGVR